MSKEFIPEPHQTGHKHVVDPEGNFVLCSTRISNDYLITGISKAPRLFKVPGFTTYRYLLKRKTGVASGEHLTFKFEDE